MQELKLLCILAIIATTTPAFAQKEKLERLMDYYAVHDTFNGTALIVRKGNILLSKGYGYRDVHNKIKNTENTVYQIGTNTRQFTAEVILQLDSKGRLGLEDKLSKYLPGFPNGERITLRNLLTHSSGIYNYTKDPVFTNAVKPIKKEEILERIKSQPLAFAPGSDFAFSNSNYFLLGLVIEKITTKKYERVLKEDILLTCSMSHSGCDFSQLRDDNKAIGYNFSGKGEFVEALASDSTLTYAGASLYSNASDLLKWHRALLHHRLLPKDWQDLAFTPHKNQYALGWNITNIYKRKFMEHAGEVNGFTSYEVRQEDDDVFIVLLENVSRQGVEEKAIANNIVQCIYDKNYILPGERKKPAVAVVPVPENTQRPETAPKPEKKAKPVNPAKYKKFTGDFEITPAFTITFSIENNELVAATPDQKSIKMVQESETMFRTTGWNAEIEFIKDAKGAYNKIVLHQQDQLIPGVRAK